MQNSGVETETKRGVRSYARGVVALDQSAVGSRVELEVFAPDVQVVKKFRLRKCTTLDDQIIGGSVFQLGKGVV